MRFQQTYPDAFVATGANWTGVASSICPDLLTLEKIGAADNLRGWVIRAFFHLMRLWSA